jgi:hypothetical protein
MKIVEVVEITVACDILMKIVEVVQITVAHVFNKLIPLLSSGLMHATFIHFVLFRNIHTFMHGLTAIRASPRASKNSPKKSLLEDRLKNNEVNFPLLLQQSYKRGSKNIFH